MAAPKPGVRLALHRLADGLVYHFERAEHPSGTTGWRRRDRPDLWLLRDADWGWVARDPVDGSVAGRSWDTLPAQQGDDPPEGLWVSRKGERSWVYMLRYENSDPDS